MKISWGEFRAVLNDRTINRLLDRSLLPFARGEKPENRDDFLKNLYNDVMTRKYFPSLPRGYIVLDKHNGVARIVPVFDYPDMCVYYFCVKEIEQYIAINRVQGTFGGWTMGNPFRIQENAERAPEPKVLKTVGHEDQNFEYFFVAAIEPERWAKKFREYQGRAYEWSRSENLTCFLKFDIANFYDAINLDILERKIRAAVPLDKYQVVDLLFVFFRNWNRGYEGYASKAVGIPQNDAGDCSRMIANFYLLDYDDFILRKCLQTSGESRYLRYADDQFIMTETSRDARQILFDASRELHKIGLNINSGKVIEFSSRDAYNYYWAFDMTQLINSDELDEVNAGVKQFVERTKTDGWDSLERAWRGTMVLNRLLNVAMDRISKDLRDEIFAIVISERVLVSLSAFAFKRVYLTVDLQQREDFIAAIERLVPKALYNNFHLNVLKFYTSCRKDAPVDHILKRISELTYD